MIAKDLIGKEVVGAGGWKIGKVKEIMIDRDTWAVTALSIDLESNIAKEFNMKKMWGKSDLTIPVGQVQGIADRIVLNTSKSQILEAAKTGTQEQEKSTAPSKS
jgi:sporulation protein YlmC with PRC-barrel domain